MSRRDLSREELFALVWEKPTREVAKELGTSDVAVGKLCARLQVPKPPRGYWARVRSGQAPRRPPLSEFRAELDHQRRESARTKAAGSLSNLQRQFYQAALSDLKRRGVDVDSAEVGGGRLPNLSPDLAAQMLLLIQSRSHDWVKEEKVAARWSHSVRSSAAKLVGKLLPLAQPQLLLFEYEGRRSYAESRPAVLVRLTASLQERIASLVRIVQEQQLHYVVMPLMAADHAWSARHVYSPESCLFLQSTLCVSASEIWVESTRKAWREEDPPERIVTGKLMLRAVMPIDYMPVREIPLPPTIPKTTVVPYHKRLRALLEAEKVHEMMSHVARTMEPEIPDETLTLAERIWFGKERPFHSAREAWRHLENELDRWEMELEAERSALARSILGIEVGDIVTTDSGGRFLRLSVSAITLYASDKHVTFVVNGTRFRKDGTLGKLQENLSLHFEDEL